MAQFDRGHLSVPLSSVTPFWRAGQLDKYLQRKQHAPPGEGHGASSVVPALRTEGPSDQTPGPSPLRSLRQNATHRGLAREHTSLSGVWKCKVKVPQTRVGPQGGEELCAVPGTRALSPFRGLRPPTLITFQTLHLLTPFTVG